jgi:hypothetical protein
MTSVLSFPSLIASPFLSPVPVACEVDCLPRTSALHTPVSTQEQVNASPPRSILKRRLPRTDLPSTSSASFSTPLVRSSSISPPDAGKSIRIRIPREKKEVNSNTHSIPLSPDFDEIELEPLSSHASSIEYFGVPFQVEISLKQKERKRREELLKVGVQQQKHISHQVLSRGLTHRNGLSRYGMLPSSITVKANTQQQQGVRRSAAGGFRVSTRPMMTPPPPPARVLSKKENTLVQKLYEANQERSRMEAEEMQYAKEEQERLAKESREIVSPKVRTVKATHSSPPPALRPETPSPAAKEREEEEEEEEEIFSPRSDESEEQEEEGEQQDVEMEDAEISDERMQIQVDRSADEDDIEAEPHTPRKDNVPMADLSQSPLLHAPKKKRTDSPASTSASSPRFSRSSDASDSPSRLKSAAKLAVRRSLLPEISEVDAEEPMEVATHVMQSTAAVEGSSPVQALLASIQRDAKDAILHNGRIYVPLPISLDQSIMAAASAVSTPAPISSPPRPPSSYFFSFTIKSHPSYVKLIEKLGGKVSYKEGVEGVTHLIASGSKEDTFLLPTPKVLSSLFLPRIFLLHPDYLKECEKQGRFVEETEWEWKRRSGHNLTRALSLKNPSSLFSSFSSLILLPKRSETQAKWIRELVEMGGGKVVEVGDKASMKKVTHIFLPTSVRKEASFPLSDPEAYAAVQSALSRHENPEEVVIADLQYVVEYVSRDEQAMQKKVVQRMIVTEAAAPLALRSTDAPAQKPAVAAPAAVKPVPAAAPAVSSRTPPFTPHSPIRLARPATAARSPAKSPSKAEILSSVPQQLAASAVASVHVPMRQLAEKRLDLVKVMRTMMPDVAPSTAAPMDISVNTVAVAPSTTLAPVAMQPVAVEVAVERARKPKSVPRELSGLTDSLSVHETSLRERRQAKEAAVEVFTKHAATTESTASSPVAARKSQKRQRSPSPATDRSAHQIISSVAAVSQPRPRVPRELADLTDCLSRHDKPSEPTAKRRRMLDL